MRSPLSPLKELWCGEGCPPILLVGDRSEVESRLKDAISPFLSRRGNEGLRGYVRNGRISVFWNTPGFGNAWRPILRGSLVGDESGNSRIEGRFSTFRITQIFCGLWFGGLAAAVAIALGASDRVTVGPNPATFTLLTTAMIALGVVMVGVGQYISRGEKERILAALREL
jgi:hypothetical protein